MSFPQPINASSSPEVQSNENFQALAHQGVYSFNAVTSSGLTWGYNGGRWGGFSVADGTFTLAGTDDTYIVVLRADGVISQSTATTNWDNGADYARVYKLTTSASAVTATEDHRAGPGGVHGSIDPGDLGGASTTQTGEMMSGYIGTVANKDYKIVVKAAHGGTITEVTTISESGTCTLTGKINTTALGGTANSVSSTEQSQAQASANMFVAGDDIVLTASANSTCVGLSFTIKYTRTLS